MNDANKATRELGAFGVFGGFHVMTELNVDGSDESGGRDEREH